MNIQPTADLAPFTGPRCGRCNRLLHHHLWQLVDPDLAEQGGVMDCETATIGARQ